ncbi:hypothetical protein WJX73_006541 [Symbiochloris irregularis]|uniref:Uncharacterized protein n=1 Tax=Symbiochloris irregularis TaxID=706552 RepID=A0AAW1NSB8_9CHLO
MTALELYNGTFIFDYLAGCCVVFGPCGIPAGLACDAVSDNQAVPQAPKKLKPSLTSQGEPVRIDEQMIVAPSSTVVTAPLSGNPPVSNPSDGVPTAAGGDGGAAAFATVEKPQVDVEMDGVELLEKDIAQVIWA